MPQNPIDPFPNPALAPTDAGGTNTNGARFGCSRVDGTTRVIHKGTDLKASVGTQFKAIYNGKVQDLRSNVPNDRLTPNSVGNFVIIKSLDMGMSMKYCHLSEVSVAIGAIINAGDVLGKTGKSGNAFNVPFPHLHIEVSTDFFVTANAYVDPEPYLKTKYTPANPNPVECPSSTPA